MEKLHTGLFIRQKWLEKDWSQEGLCRGICSVSYLSKIEQGIIAAAERSKYSISALQKTTQKLRKKKNPNDRRTTNRKNNI